MRLQTVHQFVEQLSDNVLPLIVGLALGGGRLPGTDEDDLPI